MIALNGRTDKLQRRLEAAARARIALRHRLTDWPLDAETLAPAEWLEPGDVCMPAPPDVLPIEFYREQAELPDRFDDDPDPDLVIARYHERQRERAFIEAARGTVWTIEIVDERLTAAFRVSMSWPKENPRAYGSMMPKAITQLSDLVSQAENQELKKLMSRLLRHKPAWSASDERRAREAIAWPFDYLADGGLVPLCVNAGALWRALRMNLTRAAGDHGIAPATFYRKRRAGLERIAEGLAADGKAPI